MPKTQRGFTLIELLIYSSIFAMVSIVLVYFLSVFFRGTGINTTASEIGNQANFILQKIEQEITRASFVVVNDDDEKERVGDEIDAKLGEPHKRLIIKDRKETIGPTDDSLSPIVIYLPQGKGKDSGAVIMKTGNGKKVLLTNENIKATKLEFTKVSTPPGRDMILINLVLQYQSPDPRQQISRQFLLGVGKAYAATFDTSLLPGSDKNIDIGASAPKRWGNLFLGQDLKLDGKLFITNNGTITDNPISFIQNGVQNITIPEIPANTTITMVLLPKAKIKTLSPIGYHVFVTPGNNMFHPINSVVMMGASITNDEALTIILRNTANTKSQSNNVSFSYLIIN